MKTEGREMKSRRLSVLKFALSFLKANLEDLIEDGMLEDDENFVPPTEDEIDKVGEWVGELEEWAANLVDDAEQVLSMLEGEGRDTGNGGCLSEIRDTVEEIKRITGKSEDEE